MNTKKAIILGTLGAILVGLCSFAFTKYKPKTTTPTIKATEKRKIDTTALSNGWTYNIDTTKNQNGDNINYWTNPKTFNTPEQQKPTELANTTWYFNAEINTTNIDNDLDFTSMSENWELIIGDGETLAYSDIEGNNPVITYRQQTGWTDSSYRYITINTEPNYDTTTLIDWLWNNATLLTNQQYQTYLANYTTQQYTTSYASIEYTAMNQKSYTINKDEIFSEGLIFIKYYSLGITSSIYLENGVFFTTIPNMFNSSRPQTRYTATFKISKLSQLNTISPELYKSYQQYESFYDNIANKTNIYSGNYINRTPQYNYSNPNNSGTYTNEVGTRIATFGHATSTNISDLNWMISNQNIDIYSTQRTNYIAIYYNCRVSNYYPHPTTQNNPDWKNYIDNYVGYDYNISGYAEASNPITPPDVEDGNFISLTGMMLNILTLPFTFITKAFDLTLWSGTPWAFNIKNFIMVVIAIMAFMFIIKLFTSGFSVLGNFSSNHQRNKLTKSQTKLNKAKTEKIKNEKE